MLRAGVLTVKLKSTTWIFEAFCLCFRKLFYVFVENVKNILFPQLLWVNVFDIYISGLSFLVWSREGCKTFAGKLVGTVRCECTHLTNFALMPDVSRSGSNPLSLKIITWIGCGISLFGLVLTILTYSVFRCVSSGML